LFFTLEKLEKIYYSLFLFLEKKQKCQFIVPKISLVFSKVSEEIMGKLDAYKKENPDAFSSRTQQKAGERPTVYNMLIKITDYEIGGDPDNNYVVGKRMDNGEIIKTRLIPIEQKGKYKRVEIADFYNVKHKRHVAAGNYMVLEQARQESEGVFTARWAATLDRDPQNTKAFVMLASLEHRVRKDNDGDENEFFKIRMLYPVQPVTVTNSEEFQTAVEAALKKKAPGSNPECIVRITDDTGEKEIINIYPKREEVEEDGSKFRRVVDDTAESFEYFKADQPARYEMIMAFLGDPDLKIEIISATVLYPGSATKEKLETQHESTKKRLVESFYVKKGEAVQPAQPPASPDEAPESTGEAEAPQQRQGFPEVGYHFCVVGTRSYADGTPYLTYIKPFHEYNEATSIKDIEAFNLKK
jgi:hypothetical protein